MRTTLAITLLALTAATSGAWAQGADAGRKVYESTCAGCHATGLIGAPKFGQNGDWTPRAAKGVPALYKSAMQGTPKGMPPKGGKSELSEADVRAAVDYMLARAGIAAAAAEKKVAASVASAGAKPVAAPAAPAQPAVAPAATAPAPSAPPPAAPAAPAARQTIVALAPPSAVEAGEVNAFNRLLRPLGKRNLPPAEDGIHDPDNDGTIALQAPLTAYAGLPKSNAGNRIDWVGALGNKKIAPRWDRTDQKAEPVVMDLNIVREVKGSMPDVVYPHKQHTEWLDCSNCHPAIFIPQKGANQISMAAILLGQKCGVCHGKVAFPVSECRLCHSKKKDTPATIAADVKPGAKP